MKTAQSESHRIKNFDQLPPFFMTLVSSSDIWAFLSSTGGITAGRQKADYALFPYYTDDRVSENAHNTGLLTLIRLPSGECWQPFSGEIPSAHPRVRTLFKSVAGDEITFREVRPDLGWIGNCFSRVESERRFRGCEGGEHVGILGK